MIGASDSIFPRPLGHARYHLVVTALLALLLERALESLAVHAHRVAHIRKRSTRHRLGHELRVGGREGHVAEHAFGRRVPRPRHAHRLQQQPALAARRRVVVGGIVLELDNVCRAASEELEGARLAVPPYAILSRGGRRWRAPARLSANKFAERRSSTPRTRSREETSGRRRCGLSCCVRTLLTAIA